MTPREALAQALDKAQWEKGAIFTTTIGDTEIDEVVFAAAILAALPEGWALDERLPNDVKLIWMEEGAQRERERLRALVDAHRRSVPHCPAASEMYELLEDPGDAPDDDAALPMVPEGEWEG